MRIYIVTIIILLVDYLGVKLWLVSPAEYLEGLYDNTLQAVGYIEPISIKETDTSINFILDCENIVVQGKQIGNKFVNKATTKVVNTVWKSIFK